MKVTDFAMKVTDFAERVSVEEGGKKSLSIGQIKEVLSIVDDMTNGLLYVIIKWLPG